MKRLLTFFVVSAILSTSVLAKAQPASFDEAQNSFNSLLESSEIQGLQNEYRSMMFSFMGTDVLTWIEQNPETFRAINDYVDDPPDGSAPLWETTNSKLSRGQALSAREADFKKRLEKALNILPEYRCTCFRGGALSKKALETYRESSVITNPTFYSTSIDPSVALRFSESSAKGSYQTIFIVQVHRGSPMSSFHQFHWTEYEVLLKAGTQLRVQKSFVNDVQKKAFIFLEQI